MVSFSQHHVNGLDLAANPLVGYSMKPQYPGVPDQRLKAHLGSFGIMEPLALQTMYTLPGEDSNWNAICPFESSKAGQTLLRRTVLPLTNFSFEAFPITLNLPAR